MQIPFIKEPLSADESPMLPFFVAAFEKHVEVHNAIKSAAIQAGYKVWYEKHKDKLRKLGCAKRLTPRKVCKIIRHIRLNHLIPNLVANSQGYYVTANQHEVARYYSSLKHRSDMITAVAEEIAKDWAKMERERLDRARLAAL